MLNIGPALSTGGQLATCSAASLSVLSEPLASSHGGGQLGVVGTGPAATSRVPVPPLTQEAAERPLRKGFSVSLLMLFSGVFFLETLLLSF